AAPGRVPVVLRARERPAVSLELGGARYPSGSNPPPPVQRTGPGGPGWDRSRTVRRRAGDRWAAPVCSWTPSSQARALSRTQALTRREFSAPTLAWTDRVK